MELLVSVGGGSGLSDVALYCCSSRVPVSRLIQQRVVCVAAYALRCGASSSS